MEQNGTSMKSKDPELTSAFRQLITFIKPYWFWVALNIMATLISALVDVLSGYFIKNITDLALNDQLQEILSFIYLILVVVSIGIIVKYVLKYTAGRFSSYALRDIRKKAAYALEKMPFSYVETHHSGDMVSRLTNDAYVVQGFFQNQLSNLIYQPIVFLATSAYMLTLNWSLFLWAVAVVPITLYFTHMLGKPLSKYSKQGQEGHGKINAIAQDTIGGIYMEKAFNLEPVLYDKFNIAVKQVLDNRLKHQMRLAVMTPLFIVITTIPVLSTAGYGGYLTVRGDMTPGSLFAFMFLLHFLVRPLTIIPELLLALRVAAATAGRIKEVLDQPAERMDGQIVKADPSQAVITYADVFFTYNHQVNVLNKTNFAISPQKMVALVGHSGSGKSTILKLLCGFHEPQQGVIKLYGQALDRWNLESVRRQLALVSQDTYLFPTTIAENIEYGRPGATRAEIIEAAKMANAHEFIMELPNGYESLVGERGNRLSGGQRQRIGIARAILKNAPILLLDEPTSALDTHSEALVQEALERFMAGRTVLVIAHRLSTIKQADEILVLDQGRIAERGTHLALIEKGGLYKQLYLKQFEAGEV